MKVTMFKKRKKEIGLAPGTLVHVGQKLVEKTKITVMDYSAKRYIEKEVKSFEECFRYRDTSSITWINIDGVHEADIVRKVGDHFKIHPLIQEDIMNTTQRAKVEDFGHFVYLVVRMARPERKNGEEMFEQISLVLGKNFVISFQEDVGDTLDPVRDRIRKGKGRLRQQGADYLTYALLDSIVDSYFLTLERQGEEIEALEEDLLTKPDQQIVHRIHRLKREMIFMRKAVWPLREVISGLERMEVGLIKPSTTIYLKDVYDHTIQVIDTVETYRDMLSGMLDIYLSSVSNRMNEVMKVLTIISTIFIPLTFLAGIYGMNFKFMPETEWRWGYFFVLGIMLVAAGLMVRVFRRKKWL
ncbi:MAG: magnesium and cobalt transport protein CorA [Candidatus Aminicenantes bacterium RBG_13_63_10]|nr:MAG: magnesium and cobalt transport protein CorA [Candidatus Aminicenantes bacterium RBG_13_63_10]